MYWYAIVLIVIGSFATLYSAIQLIHLFRLRQLILRNDRKLLIKKLGSDYRQKIIHSELLRYKWKKGVFVIRSDFDKTGKRVGKGKVSLRIFNR